MRIHRILFLHALLAAGASAQTAGDFNGDGYGDLAIGIPGEDVGPVASCGAAAVLYGGASGLSATGNQFWDQNALGLANEANDSFGWALAAGDFDGDGYDDLAVGVPYEDDAKTDQGAVVLIRGSASGLTATGVRVLIDSCPDGPEPGDLYGLTLAAGLWERSSAKDALAIGAPYEDVGTAADAGQVEFRHEPFSSSGTVSCFRQGGGGPSDTAEAGDHFGWSLAIANLDFSLYYNDLVVGVPGEDTEGRKDNGAVQVYFWLDLGGIYGLGPLFLTDADAATGGVENGDQFGYAVAVGAFHADGPQLAIGVPFEGIGASAMAGRVEIRRAQSLANLFQSWDQDGAGVLDQVEPYDQFGYCLAAADFDNDLFDDLAVGVPLEDSASRFDCGAAAVLFGAATGLSGAGDRLFFDGSIANGGIENGDLCGIAVGAGDVNGDGMDDLAIGIPYEDLGAFTDAGEVQLRLGPLPVVAGGTLSAWNQDTAMVADSAESSDWFGRAVR